MKGLEEWLASSSSASSSSSSSSSSSPSLNEAKTRNVLISSTISSGGGGVPHANLRIRQEEMRERMRSLLGDEVVTSVMAETSVTEESAVPQPAFNTDKRSVAEPPRDGIGGPPSLAPTPPPEEAYRRVEVMVVDRGTQTTTTVGCQTDPEPYQPCAGCLIPPHAACRCGGIRRPYASALGAGEEEGVPSRFREQLDMIQRSIDAMIARYNLPPPPPPFPRTQ